MLCLNFYSFANQLIMKTNLLIIKYVLLSIFLGGLYQSTEAQDIRFSAYNDPMFGGPPTSSNPLGGGLTGVSGGYYLPNLYVQLTNAFYVGQLEERINFFIHNDDTLNSLTVSPPAGDYPSLYPQLSTYFSVLSWPYSPIPPGDSVLASLKYLPTNPRPVPASEMYYVHAYDTITFSTNDIHDPNITLFLDAYHTNGCRVNTQVNSQSGCNGNNKGSITAVNTHYGEPPLTFNWSNGVTEIKNNYNPSSTINGLSPGTYRVTMTDHYGSVDIDSAIIASNANTVSISTTQVSCSGLSDGSAIALASGGSTPYTYYWSNGATTPSINNLSAGTYTVTVSDGNGCTAMSSATITEPSALTLQLNTTDVSCVGNDGASSAVVAGGTSPYTYQWSNGAMELILVL